MLLFPHVTMATIKDHRHGRSSYFLLQMILATDIKLVATSLPFTAINTP